MDSGKSLFRKVEKALQAIARSSDSTSIVGGDLFDFIPVSEQIRGIAIADG